MTILSDIERDQRLAKYDGPDKVISLKGIVERNKNIRKEESRKCGIPQIDSTVGGFFLGQLVVISGTTGHGKTTLAQSFTISLFHEGCLPLWFSYEVDEIDFCNNFETGYHNVIYMPSEMKGNTTAWIEDRIVEAHLKHGVNTVFIDHLHYLVAMNSRQNMSLVIGDVVRKLKEIAKKHRMLMFLICHTGKTRSEDGELNLGDVRDSSFIEQEADTVIYVWRNQHDQSVTMAKIAKNRKRGVINVSVPLVLKDRVYKESAYTPINQDNDPTEDRRTKGRRRYSYAD